MRSDVPRWLACMLLAPSLAGGALAQPATVASTQDAALRRCLDAVDLGASKGSQFAACYADEAARQDAALNGEYKRSQDRLSSKEDRASLLRGQRAWLAYRDAWCAFEGTLDAPPSPEANRLSCLVDLTKAQVARLRGVAP